MRLLVVLAATRALTPAQKPAAVTRRTAVAALAVGGTLTSPARARRRNAAEQLRQAVFAAVADDPTVAGALLRLAFHDAVRRADGQTRGADGSIRFEIPDAENVRLGRPLALVMAMKPDGLSVADAVAVAGAAAVEASGGPRIAIGLGRLDASAAAPATLGRPIKQPGDEARDVVKRTLPEPGLSTVGLRRYFRRVGLSDQELVALMGAHTLGRHNTLLNMTKACLRNLTRECLETAPVRAPFEARTPDAFDNSYYSLLLAWDDRSLERGEANFIPTDVALVLDASFRRHVVAFARSEPLFRTTFARAYAKLVR
jgi:L-ascorbate peroxidase